MAAIILCILLGLLSRSSLPLPCLFQEYGGDVLWSTMFYFIFAWIKPDCGRKQLLLITIGFSFLIEFSQMINVDWLNAARQTPFRYLLGQGFQLSDLWCYIVGSMMGYGMDRPYKKRS